jgi:hypothetical protein
MVLRADRRLHMNVGDPTLVWRDYHRRRESDMPIVVLIAEKVKAAGTKGHYCKSNLTITTNRQN